MGGSMIDTLTESDLHAALDLDPGDAVTRGVLADLLEEQGRDAEAEGVRWLLAEGKYPWLDGETIRRVRPWRWFSDAWGKVPFSPASRPHAWVGSIVGQYYYATRQEAEADLVRAARAAGMIGGGA